MSDLMDRAMFLQLSEEKPLNLEDIQVAAMQLLFHANIQHGIRFDKFYFVSSVDNLLGKPFMMIKDKKTGVKFKRMV